MIDLFEEGVFAGEEGSAGDDGFSGGFAACDELSSGVSLDGHAADEDAIGPGEVLVSEGGDIEIDEAFAPVFREHGGDGEEAERRGEGFFADDAQDVGVAPEGIGELRVEEQNVQAAPFQFVQTEYRRAAGKSKPIRGVNDCVGLERGVGMKGAVGGGFGQTRGRDYIWAGQRSRPMGFLAAGARLGMAGVFLGVSASQCNSPYPKSDEGKSILYTTFVEEPKHLDPAMSYSTDESVLMCQVVEPPLQYHFLKRPYELEPLTAEAIPQATERRVMFGGKAVDATVYTVRLKKGIVYQDHPCFVEGNRRLTRGDVRDVQSVWDIKAMGTRELVAGDYANGIRRLSDPRLACPILSTLAQNLLGMGEYAKMLEGKLDGEREARRRAGGVLHNQERDEKYNPIRLDYGEGAEAFPFVREVDRYTFEVVLQRPYPQILYWMGMAFFGPVPPEAMEFFGQGAILEKSIVFDRNPVGTGAYVLWEFDPTNQIVFRRNGNFREERYPDLPKPKADDAEAVARYEEVKGVGMLEDVGRRLPMIDTVVLRMEKETIPRWNKFVQGYYDYETTENKVADFFDEAVSLNSKGDMVLSEGMASRGIGMMSSYPASMSYYAFNMNDGVWGGCTTEKRKLRQAVSMAFDTEERIGVFFNGRGVPAQGPLAPGIFGYETGEQGVNGKVFRWDAARGRAVRRSLEEAKKLLAEAGYPGGYGADGRQLTIQYITAANRAGSQALLDFFKKQFTKLNIRLDIQVSDYNRFRDRVDKGNFQFLDWGWVADYPDPENFLFLLYGPNGKVATGGENVANYRSAAFDELFVKMRAMANTPERLEVIRKAVEVLREDSPWIFGENLEVLVLAQSWYKNPYPNAVAYNTWKYRRIDVEKRREYRRRENRPLWWPLAALGAVLAASSLPGLRVAVRHFRET